MEERTNAERLIAELDQYAMLPFHQVGSIVGDFYDREMAVHFITAMLKQFEEERISQEQEKENAKTSFRFPWAKRKA